MSILQKTIVDGVDVSDYVISWSARDEWKVAVDSIEIRFSLGVNAVLSFVSGLSVSVTRGFVTSTDEDVFVGEIKQILPQKGSEVSLVCFGQIYDAIKSGRTKTWDRNIDVEEGVGSEIFKDICDDSQLSYTSASIPTTGTAEADRIQKFIQFDEDNFQMLNRLADYYNRTISFDKTNEIVEFLPKGYRTYPISLEVGTHIPGQIKWKVNDLQLVNKVKAYGATVFDTRVETFAGPLTTVSLTYTPEDTEVRIGGISGTLQIRGQKDVGILGTTHQYYVDVENKQIVFGSAQSDIYVKYGAQVPMPIVLSNLTSIERYGGPKKIPSFKRLDLLDVKDIADGESQARAFLNKYSTPFYEAKDVPVSDSTIETYGVIKPGTMLNIIDSFNNQTRTVFVHTVVKTYPHANDMISFGDEIWRTEDWQAKVSKDINALLKELNKNEQIVIAINDTVRSIDYNRRHAYEYYKDRSLDGEHVFILGSPTFGVLGVQELGETNTTETIVNLLQGNNIYKEYFYDVFYQNATFDGVINTTDMELVLTNAGNTFVSNPIHIGEEKTGCKITTYFDKAIVFQITADADSWDSDLGYNGANSNVSYTTGFVGDWAASFNGTTSYIEIADAAPLRLNTGGTISAWINPTTMGENSAGRIVDKSTDTIASNGYNIRIAGTNQLQCSLNGATIIASNANTLSLGVWQHVAATFNGTQVILYINGVYSILANSTALPPNVAGAIRIGNRGTGTDRTFNGVIDDVRLYSSALSAADIAKLFAKEEVSTNLIAKYTFEEGGGDVAFDSMNGPHWQRVDLTSGSEATVVFDVSGSYLKYRIVSTIDNTTISSQIDADTDERESPAINIDLR